MCESNYNKKFYEYNITFLRFLELFNIAQNGSFLLIISEKVNFMYIKSILFGICMYKSCQS